MKRKMKMPCRLTTQCRMTTQRRMMIQRVRLMMQRIIMMKRNMMKRIMMRRTVMAAVCLCCMMLLCALAGCQLAREGAGANAYEDRMIGVFITTHPLDLFDHESYFSENLRGFRGGEIRMSGDAQRFQGRIYAVLTPRTLTSEETGETTEIHEYVFEGLEGIPYFVSTMPAAPGRESYRASMSDEAISGGQVSLHYGDDESSVTLEGTIYVAQTGRQHAFYFNPVYQDADGGVYLVSGTGISSSGDVVGASMTQTIEATTTITENGRTMTDSISVSVSVVTMPAPERIVILQMGQDNSVISRAEYEPDAMPEALTQETGTAYIIVETRTTDPAGQSKVAREIYDTGVQSVEIAESIEALHVREDGICVKRSTYISKREAQTY